MYLAATVKYNDASLKVWSQSLSVMHGSGNFPLLLSFPGAKAPAAFLISCRRERILARIITVRVFVQASMYTPSQYESSDATMLCPCTNQ